LVPIWCPRPSARWCIQLVKLSQGCSAPVGGYCTLRRPEPGNTSVGSIFVLNISNIET